jgi:hypothetical protein
MPMIAAAISMMLAAIAVSLCGIILGLMNQPPRD